MKYELENGKVVNIPDKEIEHLMKSLELTQADAIDLWLEDNDYQENAEQNELDEKAKKVKIDHQASAIDKTQAKEKKPRVVKISDEKQKLFDEIYHSLVEIYGGKVEIVKQNKLLTLEINGKIFKLDLIEQRASKTSGVDLQRINADYEIASLQMEVENLKRQAK